MSCEAREQELLDWSECARPEKRSREITAHLRDCADCRAMVRDFQSLSVGLARLGRGAARGRARRRPARVRTVAIVAAVLVAGAAVQLMQLRSGTIRWSAGARATAAQAELDHVQAVLKGGGPPDALAGYLRSSPSIPVRLAASGGTTAGPALHGDELADAFAEEEDLLVRLWLVAAVARLGDEPAAQQVRARVHSMGTAAPAELREAVEAYLPLTTGDEPAS